MLLDKIQISNFKGLNDCEFSPSQFGCLVGENNSGKSTVLQSIVYALNRTGQLPESLYYDPSRPVEFRLFFSGASADHLRRLAPEHQIRIVELIEDEKIELLVRYPRGEKCETKAFRKIPIEERFQEAYIADLLAGKRAPAVATIVKEHLPEFAEGLPDTANITAAKVHISNQIRQLPPHQLQTVEAPLPTGIPSSIGQLLPEPIYIPAVKNLIDDLKTNQSTTFGRLLGLLLEEMEPVFEQVQQALAELDSMLNRITEGEEVADNRHDTVVTLEGLIQTHLQNNFPNALVELRVPPPELRTILNSAQLYIDDGSKDIVDNKGDGLKRSLTFALLQAYVQQKERLEQIAEEEEDDEHRAARRPLIFLFEEPELYLHPRSQKVLFNTLASISLDNQVVVTTHSPIFFAPGITANFVRITKEERDPKPVGILHPVNFILDDSKAETFKLTRFENSDAAFFSRRVVLFEGESDDTFCRHTALKLNPEWDFDSKSIAMVRVSGKGNFAKFRKFFEAFGLEVKIVADLDVLFEGYQHLGAPAELDEERAIAIQKIDAFVDQNSIPAELTGRQIKKKVGKNEWKTKYDAAKESLQKAADTGEMTDDLLSTLNELFMWEQDVAREKACREHEDARSLLVPLLDGLRQHGICVLSKGSIEDYYPEGTKSGAKPQKALEAIRIVESHHNPTELWSAIAEGRNCEMTEVFSELFR